LSAYTTADGFLKDVGAGFYELIQPTATDYRHATTLIDQYRGKMSRKRCKPGSIDLTDAMNVIIAARTDTNLILATDQDYRAIKPLSKHPAFLLVPFDTE
jgi:predicted nucleic acid-binding protein